MEEEQEKKETPISKVTDLFSAPFRGKKLEDVPNLSQSQKIRYKQREVLMRQFNDVKKMSHEPRSYDNDREKFASLIGETITSAYSDIVYLEELLEKKDNVIHEQNLQIARLSGMVKGA